MNALERPLTGDDAPPASAAPAPQVFSRSFTTPAGFPWDQARAAQLEARHGAPLPIAELQHRVRRLEPWGPGRAGRFAVFYVRRRDLAGPFEAAVEMEGQTVRVAFGASAGAQTRMRLAAAAVAVGLLAAGAGAAVVSMVLEARQSAETELASLEQQASVKLRAARRRDAERVETAALAAARARAGGAEDVLDDLAWLSRAKVADARIVAVHWDHGLMAIESRGPGAPITPGDRQLVRAARGGQGGLQLWGVGRPTVASASSSEAQP